MTLNRSPVVSKCAQNYTACVFRINDKFSLPQSVTSEIVLCRIKEKKNSGYCKEDQATAYTAQLSITPLEQIFGDHLTRQEL
jgi:hypothetical protein